MISILQSVVLLNAARPIFLLIFQVMETQLVYAEGMNGISFCMLEDQLVQIISDTGLFIVTTLENSRKYQLDFYPVSAEAIEAYGLEIIIFNEPK